jgi:hypothetical protein
MRLDPTVERGTRFVIGLRADRLEPRTSETAVR